MTTEEKTSGNQFITIDWNSDYIDEHRRGISDLEWASKQQMGDPIYVNGDIVEFVAGGFGMIKKTSKADNGWPVSYSLEEIESKPFHPKGIVAWHYEGDIKGLIVESAIRRF